MFVRVQPIPLGLLRACAAEALGKAAPSADELQAWRDREHARKYSDDQARDSNGRFAGGGGGGGNADAPSRHFADELGASVDEDDEGEKGVHPSAARSPSEEHITLVNKPAKPTAPAPHGEAAAHEAAAPPLHVPQV